MQLFDHKRRLLLAWLVGIGLGQAAVTVASGLLVRKIFDNLTGKAVLHGGSESLWAIGSLVLFAAAAGGLRVRERVFAERLGQSCVKSLRLQLFHRISAASPRDVQRRSSGSMILRFVGDLSAIRRWVSLGIARLAVGGLAVVGALLALSLLSPVLGLATAVVLLLGLGLAQLAAPAIRGVVRDARRRRSLLAANVTEKIHTLPVLRAFGQTRREQHRIERQSERLKQAMVNRARITGRLRGSTETTAGIAVAMVLWLGSHEVAGGHITPGTVVAAMSMISLLVPGLRDLSRVFEYWQNAQVARAKLREVLDIPALDPAPGTRRRAKPGGGRIRFHQVSVAGALHEVSATVEAGQRVALVGPNGAGKSTLLNVVARLAPTSGGRISIDGRDITRLRPRVLASMVGMVGPDLPLLRGSIERNLRYRYPRASQVELTQICAVCKLDKALAGLPKGLQTRVQEGGRNLSLGERQRIAMARALLGQPRILLFDEADAHLDPEGRQVLDAIVASYPGTVLLVTHDPTRLKGADQVWYVEGGRILFRDSDLDGLPGAPRTADLFRYPGKT